MRSWTFSDFFRYGIFSEHSAVYHLYCKEKPGELTRIFFINQAEHLKYGLIYLSLPQYVSLDTN